MKAIIIIFTLLIIALYLLIRASDETRELKTEKKKVKINIFNLAKINVKLLADKFKLKLEIKDLKESNADLRSEYSDYLILKYNYEITLRNTIIDLLDLQEINSLGISEEEKNKHRNVIINKAVKSLTNKINELDNSNKHI